MSNIPNNAQAHRRLPKPIRIVRARPRLFTSASVGLLVFFALLMTDWRLPTRVLAAWDVGVALYLVLAFHLATQAQTAPPRFVRAVGEATVPSKPDQAKVQFAVVTQAVTADFRVLPPNILQRLSHLRPLVLLTDWGSHHLEAGGLIC